MMEKNNDRCKQCKGKDKCRDFGDIIFIDTLWCYIFRLEAEWESQQKKLEILEAKINEIQESEFIR